MSKASMEEATDLDYRQRFQPGRQMWVIKKDGSRENLSFDKIIIAAGSVPAVPPIPGVKLCGVPNTMP